MNSTPEELVAATRDSALAALHEITPATTVGPYADYRVEADGVISLRFQNRLAGYPGWFWTVTVAQVGDEEPTVLEAELMPGDGALLAPDWVPWAERLAEYRAHQVELAEAAAEAGSDDADAVDGDDDDSAEDDAETEDADDDEDDDDADAALSDLLHAGDLDGVDIDELDPAASDEDDSDEDDSDEDDSDDDADEDSDDEE